jgi:glycosyltransferase involved in cell wall biosynthesis
MKILVVLPAYNEEKIIRTNVLKVLDFCKENLKEFQIVIADNGSTDRTPELGQELANQHPEIEYLYIKKAGKGRAIKTAWQKYQADIYIFCDIDLPSNLETISLMIDKIKEGNYDLVVGSRYVAGAKVKRTALRKLISLFYRFLLRTLFGLKVKDAPCGIKAITEKVRDELLSQVKNTGWFFDIELLILAQKKGFQILEIPVQWQDRPEPFIKTFTKLIKIILEDLREMIRLCF